MFLNICTKNNHLFNRGDPFPVYGRFTAVRAGEAMEGRFPYLPVEPLSESCTDHYRVLSVSLGKTTPASLQAGGSIIER